MDGMTVGGLPIIGGSLMLPRVGVWHLDAVLDSPQTLSGKVSVQVTDSLTLEGMVHEGAPYVETGYFRIFGGAGALNKNARPAGYGQCQLKRPLGDLLTSVGEKLSSTSTASVMAIQLVAWATLGVPAGRQLAALLQAAPKETAWRVLPSGDYWIGLETWPASGLQFEEQGQLTHEGRIELASVEPTLMPGTTIETIIGTRRVSYAEHRIDEGKVRTLALLEAAA